VPSPAERHQGGINRRVSSKPKLFPDVKTFAIIHHYGAEIGSGETAGAVLVASKSPRRDVIAIVESSLLGKRRSGAPAFLAFVGTNVATKPLE
jgi:hypothetical protein